MRHCVKLKDLNKLFAADSNTDQLKVTLKKILLQYKITTFAFTYYAYHPHSKNKLKFDHSSSNFEPWHKHYISEDYEQIDTTLTQTYQTTLPVYWELQQQYLDATNAREKQMRLDGIKFGVEKGLSIPIHGPNDDFAILLVLQMKNETCLNNWSEIQDELTMLAKAYYHHVQKALVCEAESPNKFQLSQREIQCILLTAKKHKVTEIANFLKITERTVNFHLQSANKKLGVQNKYESVAKALSKGIILL